MQNCTIGRCKVTMNLDCDRLMITVRKDGRELGTSFWEPGHDLKWVTIVPEKDKLPPEDNIWMCRIVSLVAGCLSSDHKNLSNKDLDRLLCREDVKEFFKVYYKWRTKAEEFREEWPWNMEPSEIEELRSEGETIRSGTPTPMERTILEFIDRLIPDPAHPYYDPVDSSMDLSERLKTRERSIAEWRRKQTRRASLVVNKESLG